MMPVQIEQLDVVPRPQADPEQQPQSGQQSQEKPPHELDHDVERAIALRRSRDRRLRAT
jgi:hypothetical protein